MIDDEHPLVLGSASPRRREILATLRIPFMVAPASVDEAMLPGETPNAYLERVTRTKLVAVAASDAASGGRALLVADTIVVVDGAVLGKPATTDDAEEMLARLSGRGHEVATRFAIADGRSPADASVAHEQTVVSRVYFRPLSQDEIRRYAATGEGLDKAGAYAVQGLGSFMVSRIEGSYASVVGLPACEVVAALERLGLLGPFPR